MWIVLLVSAPQLRTDYEFRIQFDSETCAWTSLVLPRHGDTVCFDGDCETTANTLFERIFSAIGKPELVPSLN